MSALTIVLAASIVIMVFAAALIYKSRKSGNRSGLASADQPARPRPKVRFGQFETDQRVAVRGIDLFGRVEDRMIGMGRIVGFANGGRAVLQMDNHRPGVFVRRVMRRLRSLEVPR
ncbi:MAG: hypothetical protein A2745_01445 [Candidatus Harrisonbacteria bacterium RIFCSPHIGHO2_01_FULL_44_13]|uniref:Uncharacterized protein n=1 Tax=Candidatus Harrisonbacteria bacterium RIFCSPLOWO2_01_FULL_44_18 TaxID=1798407 RepID=A0A1G1ZKJ5_9BACT|nr:MAG: hypothetical protein A2745_01445 [Candidatus Harrisonbacteria bacterium RIFCSPHIGHO2_01_FULL_44_13]OGY65148.1 MAG: hypothetical protein A3A16_00405 [Candidatus Harrisonbacteria bacterium RIFCSPLOWO2_01_FULL_44_18]